MTELRPLAEEAPLWAGYGPIEQLPPPVIADPSLPLVSIVTPSYNQGRFIGETIESILGQDYPNLEQWVIDAGSTDETLAVLERYRGDPRLRWISEPDKGQSDAINKGWARCRGRVLTWLNSDDTFLPGAVRGQVEALLAMPGAGGVYGDAFYTDAAGSPRGRIYARPFSPTAVLSLKITAQPAVFLCREIVSQVGPIDLRRRYGMDVELWSRAIRLAPWAQYHGAVATYRLHDGSKTVSQFAGFYGDWLDASLAYYGQPGLARSDLADRPGVLADIYAAMANLEARDGRLSDAVRYAIFALTLAGPRKRLLKLPVSLLDRVMPLGLSPRVTELWGQVQRLRASLLSNAAPR